MTHPLPDPHLTAVGAYAGALHRRGWLPVAALRAAAAALPRPVPVEPRRPRVVLHATSTPGRYMWAAR